MKKIIQGTLLSVVFILLAIFTLAVREYSIHSHSSKLLQESRLIRAHFTEFNEYITEHLLAGLSFNIEKTTYEAELIGQKGSDLANHTLVPEEFKLLLVNRSDMTKLMARIRLLSTQSTNTKTQLTIYSILRNINSRITRFDDGFCQYVKQQQQAAQNLLRGSLAIATVFLATLLFLLYIHVTKSVLQQSQKSPKYLPPNVDNMEFAPEELRVMSLSIINELPPQRGCHNIMNHANGIINCAQILRDQKANVDLQENENQKLITDLWQSGKKIAARVTHLRSLQQLYTSPLSSIEDSIELLVSWMELQFPEISQILERKTSPHLPHILIPPRDLFLAIALLAEQVIPEPGHDYGSCKYTKLKIETYPQTEKEIVIEMILQLESGTFLDPDHDVATHVRQHISNGLLSCYESALEVSRGDDQTIIYRFLLT